MKKESAPAPPTAHDVAVGFFATHLLHSFSVANNISSDEIIQSPKLLNKFCHYLINCITNSTLVDPDAMQTWKDAFQRFHPNIDVVNGEFVYLHDLHRN